MITQTDKFYKDFVYIINRKYKISIKVYESVVDDPFLIYLKVGWKNGNQRYEVNIDKDKIGPARLADAVKLFNIGINENYPELLL